MFHTVRNVVLFGGLGPELVVNGAFDADTDWAKGTGWAIASGVATATAVAAGQDLAQAGLPSYARRRYRIVFTISAYTGGGVSFRLGTSLFNDGVVRTSAGTFTEEVTAVSNNGFAMIRRSTDFTGSIDGVSVREILG